MKQVLIIDASPMFREFLTDKLSAEKIAVEVSQGERDAFIKMISILPDLVVIDIKTTSAHLAEFLFKKQNDPNAKSIPIIISGPTIEHEKLAQFIQYGVIKYFTKPIKFDIFFETIGRVLKEPFSIDMTPCILDLHLNNNIIFVEISEGLNREKLSLLKYKISEMIDANDLNAPKIVVMLTNLTLSFVDVTNLELLFSSVIGDERIKKKNIKILSLDPIIKELINGHPEYDGIEVVNNLSIVLNSLVESPTLSNTPELITDKILSADRNVASGSVEMRFLSDSGDAAKGESTGNMINIAVIDNGSVTRQILKNALFGIGANCSLFATGEEFLKTLPNTKYNLIILDVFINGGLGFEILRELKKNPKSPPVIVYSQVVQPSTIIQVLSLGAKTFMAKPQKPEVIAKKAVDVLNGKS
ncbi:response regulator [Treponema parvum]|uniref:Response regulator n=1 Tax=Treponema parvum TaxID=138851 RepID=A0A975F5D7_9SPIR|nr:response regulator [Treponema parvum]QTQ14771.1 response regulator [Treponema parvum]